MNKTPDEILRELSTGNFAQFIAAFKNEALQGLIAAKTASEVIEESLNDEDFGKEEIREYVQMIQQSANETINWLDALYRYAENSRWKSV